MKLLTLALILTGSLLAQDKPKSDPVMVIWETQEKCLLCGASYAMVCGSDNPGCNTPTITKRNYEKLDSLEDAIKFVNARFSRYWGSGSNTVSLASGPITICSGCGSITPVPPTPPIEQKLVGIYRLTEIPITKTVTTKTIPQPPKTEDHVAYEVKK